MPGKPKKTSVRVEELHDFARRWFARHSEERKKTTFLRKLARNFPYSGKAYRILKLPAPRIDCRAGKNHYYPKYAKTFAHTEKIEDIYRQIRRSGETKERLKALKTLWKKWVKHSLKHFKFGKWESWAKTVSGIRFFVYQDLTTKTLKLSPEMVMFRGYVTGIDLEFICDLLITEYGLSDPEESMFAWQVWRMKWAREIIAHKIESFEVYRYGIPRYEIEILENPLDCRMIGAF